MIYFQEINIDFSSVYYLHAVTAQIASVCVHSVNPGFPIDLDTEVLKGNFCINILGIKLLTFPFLFAIQYSVMTISAQENQKWLKSAVKTWETLFTAHQSLVIYHTQQMK